MYNIINSRILYLMFNKCVQNRIINDDHHSYTTITQLYNNTTIITAIQRSSQLYNDHHSYTTIITAIQRSSQLYNDHHMYM